MSKPYAHVAPAACTASTPADFTQFYRIAASEVADEAFRPRAISLAMAGGVVAALVGPSLARLGGPLFAAEYKAPSSSLPWSP